MNKEEFLKRYRRLEEQALSIVENRHCFNSSDCVRCNHSTFSTGCTDCHRCNYCVDCRNITNSNHCTRCTDSHYCNNCIDASHVVHGSFLTFCTQMTDCTYCLGCAGLEGKDFHILNEPHDRRTYFELERTILAALGIRR